MYIMTVLYRSYVYCVICKWQKTTFLHFYNSSCVRFNCLQQLFYNISALADFSTAIFNLIHIYFTILTIFYVYIAIFNIFYIYFTIFATFHIYTAILAMSYQHRGGRDILPNMADRLQRNSFARKIGLWEHLREHCQFYLDYNYLSS